MKLPRSTQKPASCAEYTWLFRLCEVPVHRAHRTAENQPKLPCRAETGVFPAWLATRSDIGARSDGNPRYPQEAFRIPSPSSADRTPMQSLVSAVIRHAASAFGRIPRRSPRSIAPTCDAPRVTDPVDQRRAAPPPPLQHNPGPPSQLVDGRNSGKAESP